jgi:hypothetical protein
MSKCALVGLKSYKRLFHCKTPALLVARSRLSSMPSATRIFFVMRSLAVESCHLA